MQQRVANQSGSDKNANKPIGMCMNGGGYLAKGLGVLWSLIYVLAHKYYQTRNSPMRQRVANQSLASDNNAQKPMSMYTEWRIRGFSVRGKGYPWCLIYVLIHKYYKTLTHLPCNKWPISQTNLWVCRIERQGNVRPVASSTGVQAVTIGLPNSDKVGQVWFTIAQPILESLNCNKQHYKKFLKH